VATGIVCPLVDRKPRVFAEIRKNPWTTPADTSLGMADIRRLGGRLCELPEDFELHPRVAKIIEDRRMMAVGATPMDWGFAENLAYASLVDAGHPVRLSGQDAGRGTFFHRHAVLLNQRNGDEYIPLQHVSDKQARFTVINSILSEEAALGFEYGFSAASPDTLVVWEAQFGDFANGAQVVIDQFIASGEVKWGRVNGLTLMLPHGYEGQGPEHSSARLERFMQLAADHNMQIVQPTSASQIFHLLRRQMVRQFRKPLVIMTPKSLLRAKDATSPLSEFTKGEFKTVIGPTRAEIEADKVKRVIACSGKVAYDLIKYRDQRKAWDVAILRVEQLYPFPHKAFAAEMKRYSNATEVVWCQDEPQNQGAWFFVQHYIHENMNEGQKLGYAGRPASASPAVGYAHLHQEQLKTLLDQALGKLKGFVLTK
jgi:2-oxoglutarate dehydrogenase E1 component